MKWAKKTFEKAAIGMDLDIIERGVLFKHNWIVRYQHYKRQMSKHLSFLSHPFVSIV